MPFTDWKNASSISSIGFNDGGLSVPSRIIGAQDGSEATWTGNNTQESDTYQIEGFGFSTADVPLGATITGIEARIYMYHNSGAGMRVQLQLQNASSFAVGASQTESSGAAFPSYVSFGGTGDMWTGSGLDENDVRDANFGLQLNAQGDSGSTGTINIDHVQLRVEYTTGGGGGGGDTPSVNVTRGSTVIASGATTATLTEGVDFTLTDTGATKWFARITNTRHGGMGQISGGGNHNGNQFTAHLEYSGNNVVITRQGTGLDCRVDWEVIEYTGPSGGANEWIVRERGVKTIAAASLSGSYANPGSLVSTGDGLIWITGQSTTNSSRNNVNDGQFMARFNGGNFEFERRNSASSAEVSYAIIEYVGSNWSVQQQEFTEGATNSDQTISPALSDFNTTVHHAQPTYGSGSGGLDDISARTDITSNTNINFLSNGDFANRRTSVWFLSNAGLTVQRFTGTMVGTGEEEVEDLTITAVTLAEASVTGTTDSTGSGTAFPRGFVNLTLADATTLRLRQSDNGQTSRYGLEVFEWPQDPASAGVLKGRTGGTFVAGVLKGRAAGTFQTGILKERDSGAWIERVS